MLKSPYSFPPLPPFPASIRGREKERYAPTCLSSTVDRTNTTSIYKIERGTQSATADKDIARLLNDHFTDVGPSLNCKLPLSSLSDIDQFIPHINTAFSFSTISPSELVKCARSMKASRSGYLTFCPSLLYKCAIPIIAEPLTYVLV